MEMNIFLAAVYTNGYMRDQTRYTKLNEVECSVVNRIPNILESYHYINSQRIVDVMRAHGAKVFLDSGAFSAWNIGEEIDINAYCDYIKKNWDLWRVEDDAVMFSVLDGIGDPLKTWQNQLYMEQQGVRPLPCFHFGEDTRYLDWYTERYSYITLGGMVGKTTKQLREWLDKIWNDHLVDSSGKPKTKVHAFGITSFEIMERYPWFSCDSSTWIQTAAFGNIMTHDWGNIATSNAGNSKHQPGRHVWTLSPIEQEAFYDYFKREGFDMDRLATVYESRAVFNINTFLHFNDEVNKIEPTFRKGALRGLFE